MNVSTDITDSEGSCGEEWQKSLTREHNVTVSALFNLSN